ncbi:MAG: hypothetical protein IJU44_07915 [Kiritimatiellae bacterium]|nr:hypothetical protein [Kiritimatiellia bacterium]
MKRITANLTSVYLMAATALSASGRELRVGPGEEFPKPSAAAAAAADGDTVVLRNGTYRGDVCVWRQNRLTIKSAGTGKTIIDADGECCQGKATWIVKGNDTHISGITFRGAKSPDKNGAGIRLEGDNLTLTGCVFHDNENGVLCGALPDCTVTVNRCEFFSNGAGDGYSHNLYIGKIKKLVFKNSKSHHARIGHNLKSRALESVVEDSEFDDGKDGTSSYLADFPNGGIITIRNCKFHQSAKASNAIMVAVGEESPPHPQQKLDMKNNRVTNRREHGVFLKNRLEDMAKKETGASSAKKPDKNR